jgi:hypothetical protein
VGLSEDTDESAPPQRSSVDIGSKCQKMVHKLRKSAKELGVLQGKTLKLRNAISVLES